MASTSRLSSSSATVTNKVHVTSTLTSTSWVSTSTASLPPIVVQQPPNNSSVMAQMSSSVPVVLPVPVRLPTLPRKKMCGSSVLIKTNTSRPSVVVKPPVPII